MEKQFIEEQIQVTNKFFKDSKNANSIGNAIYIN